MESQFKFNQHFVVIKKNKFFSFYPPAYSFINQIHHLLKAFTYPYPWAHKLHKERGCICYENTEMGIYFIKDPDGYWLEIVPAR